MEKDENDEKAKIAKGLKWLIEQEEDFKRRLWGHKKFKLVFNAKDEKRINSNIAYSILHKGKIAPGVKERYMSFFEVEIYVEEFCGLKD